MKWSTLILTAITVALLSGTALTQTSGVLWIKTFEPGSSALSAASIDQASLLALDELMQETEIEVTFLGAADSVAWYMNGKSVHTHIAEAWNDAKRLGRARALRARYQKGNVGVTHENIAGVKVVWSKKISPERYEEDLTDIKSRNSALSDKIAKLETHLERIQPLLDAQISAVETNSIQRSYFDWFLQGGLWAWQSGTSKNLVSPSIALGIIINQSSFILQGGVTPWQMSGSAGDHAESFVYIGLKHMKNKTFGISGGLFRGWEFLTATDDWSFKTTGLSTGIIVKHSIFEFNPMLSYSSSDSIFGQSEWRFGTTLGLSININEAF